MADQREDWASIQDAAARADRASVKTIYRWMALPLAETGIKRRKIGRKTFVHIPTLLDYEASIKQGRPRKT